MYIFLKEIDNQSDKLKYIYFQFHRFQFTETLFSQVCIHCKTREKTLEYGNRSVESITNQSFPETNERQLGLKKIGRIVRNQRGEDLFGGKSDCFDKLSDFPQRYQTCQDTWRGTRKWNLVEIWLPNDSPIPLPSPTYIHTHKFSFILYNFFPSQSAPQGTKEAKEERKKGGKTVDSAFFSFSVIKPVKKLYFFAPSFNFYRNQFVQGPCRYVSWVRVPVHLDARENVLFCVAIRESYAESSLNQFSVFNVTGMIRPPHPTFRLPIHPIPVWYRPVIARISSLSPFIPRFVIPLPVFHVDSFAFNYNMAAVRAF